MNGKASETLAPFRFIYLLYLLCFTTLCTVQVRLVRQRRDGGSGLLVASDGSVEIYALKSMTKQSMIKKNQVSFALKISWYHLVGTVFLVFTNPIRS